jgi:hypothetical protein
MTSPSGGDPANNMPKLPTNITPGLIVHCPLCNLVIPSDAPQPESYDCEFVAKHKLAFYNPKETIAGQHVQAVATWALIYDAQLEGSEPATTYYKSFQKDRKTHFANSAVRKAMTPEQVIEQAKNKRDGALYK